MSTRLAIKPGGHREDEEKTRMNSGGRNGTLIPLNEKNQMGSGDFFTCPITRRLEMLTFSEEDSVRARPLGLLLDLFDVPGRSVTGSDLFVFADVASIVL